MKNTTFSNKDRRKIYKLRSIKNNAPQTIMPKQHSDHKKREEIIKHFMTKLPNRIFLPSLNAWVAINRKSILETIHHAARKAKSTHAVLNIESIFANAVYIKECESKHTKSQACFRKMHILMCLIKGLGYVKLVVGEFYKEDLSNTKYMHYCISQISIRQIKK